MCARTLSPQFGCERLDASGSDLFGRGERLGLLDILDDGTLLLNNVDKARTRARNQPVVSDTFPCFCRKQSMALRNQPGMRRKQLHDLRLCNNRIPPCSQ